MKDIFKTKVNPKVRVNDSMVQRFRTNKYENKILNFLVPKIWNYLPPNTKSEKSFQNVKEYIKTWFGS